MRIALVAALASTLLAAAAHAEPGLEAKVEEPYVKAGVSEIELRGARLIGKDEDGESAAVLEYEYGLNRHVRLGVVAEFEDEVGARRKLDAIGLETVIRLPRLPGGVDTGLYLEYAQRLHNESGVLEAKALFAKRAGPFLARLNLIAGRPLTRREGQDVTAFSYAASADWGLGRDRDGDDDEQPWRVGVEAFGDLGTDHRFGGRQAHYLGPSLSWATPAARIGELELRVGYLFPLGRARDDANGQFRFGIELERRF